VTHANERAAVPPLGLPEARGVPNHEAYPFCLPAVRELHDLEFHSDVTFIVGENGCGKSTLLEGIAAAWGFNPEGGTVNFRFSTNR
jgi:predicted ATPase